MEAVYLALAVLGVIGVGVMGYPILLLSRCFEGHWFFSGGYLVARHIYCNKHAPEATDGR